MKKTITTCDITGNEDSVSLIKNIGSEFDGVENSINYDGLDISVELLVSRLNHYFSYNDKGNDLWEALCRGRGKNKK